ncbi:LysR family transcriptional regulator [Acidovorax sp. NCPPB 3576]|uniref:LysR family transcriptional regulator n=1 Tax=Acidovorax sp. NCPPB 3576 TaxID=2940488 RepID=UPI00234AB871|nr:LysR family transcriptional regulator [Acidovorax sp. NCPPB 3576]WCM86807.1 LysR family transcriptional regulator [Acidovorax sp. NCPPB 3576]
MRIRHLQYFLIVAQEQSFVRAAARANIEPSPLSRAIKDLEEQLGVQLLNRTKGRITLTWCGEVFRDEARRIIEYIESAKTRVAAASLGFKGRLRVGITDSLAQPRLTRLLSQSREEEPSTEIRITEMTVNEMQIALRYDQIDMGFTMDEEPVDGYLKHMVWKERPAIAIPKHHPILSQDKVSMREVVRYPLIMCHPERWAGGYKVIQRWITDHDLASPTVAEHAACHEAMMMLVAAGYGVGIGMQSQAALYDHPNVIVRPMVDEIPDVPTFIVISDENTSPETTRFIQRARQIGMATPTD